MYAITDGAGIRYFARENDQIKEINNVKEKYESTWLPNGDKFFMIASFYKKGDNPEAAQEIMEETYMASNLLVLIYRLANKIKSLPLCSVS